MKQLQRSIYFKLTAIIIIISLGPVAFLTVNSISTTRDYITNESLSAYHSMASEYSSGLDFKLGYYYDLLTLLSSNMTIQDALTTTSPSSSQNPYTQGLAITNEVSKFISSDRLFSVEGCMIYSRLENIPIYHHMVSVIDSARLERWYPYYLENSNYITYTKYGSETLTLSIFKDIIGTSFYNAYYSKPLALIKLDVSVNSVFSDEAIRSNSKGCMTYIVMDKSTNEPEQGYEIIYQNNSRADVADDAAHFVSSGVKEQYFTASDGTQLYLIVTPLNYCGLSTVILFPTDEELLHMRDNLIITLLFIAGSALFVLLASMIYSKKFTARLQLLLSKMKLVEAGDTKVQIDLNTHTGDEISNLYDGFNKMVSRLDETISMNYIAELEKKEAQLHSLQLQINPHFLYNTLETIGAIAMSHQIHSICDICEKLGDMFRYATNKENRDLVTVTDEIEHVTNYVFIQKLRFQDLFEVNYNLDPMLAACSMPRFVLQPIVENAILHGLRNNTEKGCLEISAFREGNCCMITITDDGVGMSHLQTDYLNSYINNNSDSITEVHRQSIGLKNVNTRIKLLLGEEYGISISSIKGSGTTVTVRLPLVLPNSSLPHPRRLKI